VKWGDVVILANKSVQTEQLAALLRQDQAVLDLVNLDASRRFHGNVSWEGICW
jgi:hypothetical protein